MCMYIDGCFDKSGAPLNGVQGSFNWFAVKELRISCHDSKTMFLVYIQIIWQL